MGQEAVIVSLKVLHLLVNLLVAHVTHEKIYLGERKLLWLVGPSMNEGMFQYYVQYSNRHPENICPGKNLF